MQNRKGQLTVTDFFRTLDSRMQAHQVQRQFDNLSARKKKERARERARIRKHTRSEATVGLHTQNVMGFSKSASNIDAWFSHFRATQDAGALDVVFLQETHVQAAEVGKMQSRYSRHWGFNDALEGRNLSLWTGTPGRCGGVAILLHPYSSITT
jgi:hypothetical protein